MLKLADECGAIAALRHAGRGQITTAAIDLMTFLAPVYVGERVEISAEVTYVGRTSIETRIEIVAEPIESAERRRVAVGHILYVALDESAQRPRPVRPLLIATEAEHLAQEAARARQAFRLARLLSSRDTSTRPRDTAPGRENTRGGVHSSPGQDPHPGQSRDEDG